MAHEKKTGDQYALPRDQTETKRLNEQHKYLTGAYGFLVHPSIDLSAVPEPRIADIACGTGIWLTDVLAEYPHARGDGFDISGNQFPGDNHLGELGLRNRVLFHIKDAAAEDGYGAEYEGKFDVVAVRLMHINITGSQWDQAVKNATALLKPGGSLQWIDWDPRSAKVVQSKPLFSHTGLEELLEGFDDFLDTRDTCQVNRLAEIMKSNGLGVRSESFAVDEHKLWRGHILRTMVSVLPNVVRRTCIGKPGSKWDEVRLERVTKQAQEDASQDGVWIRFEIQCHVGRKAV